MEIFWGILLIVSVGIAIAYRYYPRRKKTAKPEYVGMQEMGFSEVGLPDATLRRNVIQLHHKYEGQKLTLQDIFRIDHEGLPFYLFDIQDEAGKVPVLITQDMVALISPRLNLPRLVVISRPNASGGLGAVADRFMLSIADWEKNEQGLKFVSFEEDPDFNRRFLFFTTEPERVKEFIMGNLRQFLENLPQRFSIDLFADTFTIVQNSPDRSVPRKERILLTLSKAVELNRLLQD